MSANVCPDHGPVMQESNKKPGTFYCPKVGDGPKGYCRWKTDDQGRRYQWPKLSKASDIPPPQVTQNVAKQATSAGVDHNWLASLDFAAMVYRGTGKSTEALELASAARALLP